MESGVRCTNGANGIGAAGGSGGISCNRRTKPATEGDRVTRGRSGDEEQYTLHNNPAVIVHDGLHAVLDQSGAALQIAAGVVAGNLLVLALMSVIVEEVTVVSTVVPMLAASLIMVIVGTAACFVPAHAR